MITYNIYPVHEVWDVLKGHEEDHYKDIKDKSMYPDISMNWEMYEELGREDLCFAVLAKDGEALVGYSVYTLTTDLNRNNFIGAANVAMFIEPEYRGRLVVDFIKECDKMLIEKDVTLVLHTHSDVRIGKLLEKADYNPRSITWCKRL